MTTTTAATNLGGGLELADLIDSFELSLRAANKAPRTLDVYLDSIRQLETYLRSIGAPTAAARLTREHIELFEVSLQERGLKPTTVSVRHRALQSFFKWAAEEREIPANPMATMKAPIVPEVPVPVPKEADLKKLLQACSGRSFEQVRDNALIRLYIDTGIRAAEGIGLKITDVDLKAQIPVAYVLGKGRRPRGVPLGARTAQAIDRYLRARKTHPYAHLEALWLGSKGALTDSGLRQMLERRCDQAGIARIHAHQLRHHFAHSWMSQNGAENELMALTGWKSRAMLSRYAASTVAERAAETHRRLSPGDKL